MTWIHPAWVEHQHKRFTRPDAERYTRPDAYRWQRPGQVGNGAPSYLRKSYEPYDSEKVEANDEWSAAELHEQRLALAKLRLDWELLKLAIKARKAGFDPNQSRDDRGRWTDSGGSGDLRIVAAGMPRIPRQRPPSSPDRTAIKKAIAKWVDTKGPAILETIAKTSWLYSAIPEIWSYLDAPKTLEDLQQELSPNAGYDRHHIVERTAAERDGYLRSRIDRSDNLVRIPRMKHWEINVWFDRENEKFQNQTPRDYLRGKDWDERRRVGLEALEKFGVLKR